MWRSRYFAETTIFYVGLFCKHFVFFKAHPLPKEQELFQQQPLDFPSTIAHGSTVGPFKNHFSQKHLFLKQNTNCHTTPDSSIPVDIDYSNRFELCAEVYTLPLVRLCDLIASETRNRISFFPRTSLP
jgi:hypothetical protein